jgi:hypothetical protein
MMCFERVGEFRRYLRIYRKAILACLSVSASNIYICSLAWREAVVAKSFEASDYSGDRCFSASAAGDNRSFSLLLSDLVRRTAGQPTINFAFMII